MFLAVLLTIVKTWQQPKYLLTDEWMNEWRNVWVRLHIQIHESIILPFATTQVNTEHITLRELSQTQKDKYHMTSLTHLSSKS
jgi:hypothetical protein